MAAGGQADGVVLKLHLDRHLPKLQSGVPRRDNGWFGNAGTLQPPHIAWLVESGEVFPKRFTGIDADLLACVLCSET